jgi:ABC-type antimicrobial peptide transport system permease subunit
VAGVVEDGKYKTLTEDPRPVFFVPLLQMPSTATSLVVRSEGDPLSLAGSVHDTIRGLDAGLPATITTWEKALDSALFAARMATISLGVLGMLGAMLVAGVILAMLVLGLLAAYAPARRALSIDPVVLLRDQ